ncbi:MAG: hypothetical protein EAZ74_06920 [Alphaproteobacteria bacterium]|nr:MAG: hypothetical protein EAZ74_06920 [Alphaproteobacteria bacterium]
MQPIYTDGIANIAFHDGVVRLELVTTRQVDKDKQEMTPAGSVAISLPALLRVHNQLGKAIENMVERGILSKKATGESKQ